MQQIEPESGHPPTARGAAEAKNTVWFQSWLASSTVSDNLSHAQIVIVVAKWVLVFAGLLLVLWAPAAIEQLRIQILVLLLIAVENFYHHAQLLKRRPVPDGVAYIASAADLAVVTVLVTLQGGFESNLYIFYFPALVALSVVFHNEATALFTAATVSIYGTICLADALNEGLTAHDTQILLTRLLMMIAVAACGALFYRLEERRRASGTAAEPPRTRPSQEARRIAS